MSTSLALTKAAELMQELGRVAFLVPEFRVHLLLKQARELLSKTNPADAAILYMAMGHAYVRLGDHAKALSMHSKAAKLEPRNSVHLNNVGVSMLEVGDAAGALDAWVAAIEIVGDARGPEELRYKAVATANLAEAFAVLGDADTASEAIGEAIAIAMSIIDDVNTVWIVARQSAIVGEDDAAVELVARAFTMFRGMARGSGHAIDVIESTPSDIRSRFVYSPELHAVLDRARRFRGLLEQMPRRPRGVRSAEGAAAAREVFEETREARERATSAALEVVEGTAER